MEVALSRERVEQFFAGDGPVAGVVGDHYRHRPEQVRLAQKIHDTVVKNAG